MPSGLRQPQASFHHVPGDLGEVTAVGERVAAQPRQCLVGADPCRSSHHAGRLVHYRPARPAIVLHGPASREAGGRILQQCYGGHSARNWASSTGSPGSPGAAGRASRRRSPGRPTAWGSPTAARLGRRRPQQPGRTEASVPRQGGPGRCAPPRRSQTHPSPALPPAHPGGSPARRHAHRTYSSTRCGADVSRVMAAPSASSSPRRTWQTRAASSPAAHSPASADAIRLRKRGLEHHRSPPLRPSAPGESLRKRSPPAPVRMQQWLPSTAVPIQPCCRICRPRGCGLGW